MLVTLILKLLSATTPLDLQQEVNSFLLSEAGTDMVTVGDGGDVDFRVRTNNDDNTLYIVGSTDNVGIG